MPEEGIEGELIPGAHQPGAVAPHGRGGDPAAEDDLPSPLAGRYRGCQRTAPRRTPGPDGAHRTRWCGRPRFGASRCPTSTPRRGQPRSAAAARPPTSVRRTPGSPPEVRPSQIRCNPAGSSAAANPLPNSVKPIPATLAARLAYSWPLSQILTGYGKYAHTLMNEGPNSSSTK